MRLWTKLQIKDPSSLEIIGLPEDLIGVFHEVSEASAGDKTALLVFCESQAHIRDLAMPAIHQSPHVPLLWLAYPKRSGQIKTDIARDNGWQALEDEGWVPVRVVSLSEDWSALRFRPKGEIKKMIRGTDYPGIDRKRQTVQIPKELQTALDHHGLLEHFESLSFSKRREWVVGLLSAKKEATRLKRVQQVVEGLQD